MRADARKNQDRLLEAATRAFARDGADASLKAIAQDAGVGIGTLYRRFPSRERLAWTVYQAEVERICGQASTLLTDHQPDVALRRWMSEFLTFLATKAGMADALKAALAADEVAMVRGEITAALAGMIGAGVAAGTMRSGVDPTDVLMALGGTALITDRPGQAERLLDLILAGLRTQP